MSVGYFDTSSLSAVASPGAAGDLGAAVWKSLDAVCVLDIVEFQVPSNIGRSLDRIAWTFLVNSLTIVRWTPDMHTRAVDLGWLGASACAAMHIACAEVLEVDHFVTGDPTVRVWAEARGLNVVDLRQHPSGCSSPRQLEH